MPEYIARQVREARIFADNIDLANLVGNAVFTGDPSQEEFAEADNWTIIEAPSVKVFMVEED